MNAHFWLLQKCYTALELEYLLIKVGYTYTRNCIKKRFSHRDPRNIWGIAKFWSGIWNEINPFVANVSILSPL